MTRGWTIFLAATAAIVIPGGIWAGVGIAALRKIGSKVVKYQITKIEKSSLGMSITVLVKNPSEFRILIRGYNINIALNGVNLGNITDRTTKIIKANTQSTLVIPVNFSLEKRPAEEKKILNQVLINFATLQYKKINVSLNGKFRGEILKIPVPVQIDMNYTFEEIIKAIDEPSDESQ